MLGRGRLFKRPRAGSDDSDDGGDCMGGESVASKPLDQRYARRLDASYRPRNFVTASGQSQREFYGEQELLTGGGQGDADDGDEAGLSADEKNRLNAKLMKAEMMGNSALADKIRQKLSFGGGAPSTSTAAAASSSCRRDSRGRQQQSAADRDRGGRRRSRSRSGSGGGSRSGSSERADDSRDVLLTRTDYRSGLTMPVKGGRSKDDAHRSIRDMVEEERTTTADDQLAMIGDLASKSVASATLRDDLTIDDLFTEKAAKKKKRRDEEKAERKEVRKRAKQIDDFKRSQDALSSCRLCVESRRFPKHRVVAMGLKTYLAVPERQPLVAGHCVVIPMSHVGSAAQMDEDVFDEMKIWRKGLVAMFAASDEDVLFMEMASRVHQLPHALIEAIPLPNELGDVAPVYFKKAILECEAEWADNKKLVDLSAKDIRRSVPKGFSYFAVDFGLQGGYAHVIEDEKTFPPHFGKEIVAGMLDLPHTAWRKPAEATFEQHIHAVAEMKQRWQPYDWTERVKRELRMGDSADDG